MKVVIDFTRYPDGNAVLKIGDRGSRIGGDLRTDRKFINPTESSMNRLFKVAHVKVSSSNGEIGWWQLWRLL